MATKTLFPDHVVQTFLQTHGAYKGKIDGDFGPISIKAMEVLLLGIGIVFTGWNLSRKRLSLEQFMLTAWGFAPGKVDGLWGIQTQDAWERWQNKERSKEGKVDRGDKAILITKPPAAKIAWPLQRNIRKFYGEPGQNIVLLTTPYPLRIAWDKSSVVRKFAIHEKCHDSAKRVMARVLSHYGESEIKRLGLDLFGGCLNHRLKKGGSTLSLHAWGIAIDWDPESNQFRWGANKARLDNHEYVKFMDLWEEEGWLSLGRARNYDWMHIQAARLG